MNKFVAGITRNPKFPLNLRRKIGHWFLPVSNERYSIEVGERSLQGTLDNYIDRTVYITGDYFEYTYLNLFKTLVDGQGSALDIGANIGNHSIHFSTYFDHVYSFEPFTPVFKELQLRTEGIPNIHINQLALSNSSGELSFEPPQGQNYGAGRISESGSVKVPVVIGDDVVDEICSGPINFIKIDTEGHELQVLDGLQNTIINHRPVIAFEIPKNDSMSRDEGYRLAAQRIPEDYKFFGLKSQSTFPIQVETAKAIPMTRQNLKGGCKLAIALPVD